jgi:hypothetical protein
MSSPLELATTDELVDELKKRCRSMIIMMCRDTKTKDSGMFDMYFNSCGGYLEKLGLCTEATMVVSAGEDHPNAGDEDDQSGEGQNPKDGW